MRGTGTVIRGNEVLWARPDQAAHVREGRETTNDAGTSGSSKERLIARLRRPWVSVIGPSRAAWLPVIPSNYPSGITGRPSVWYARCMLVAIRTPTDNDRGPRYMEKALAAIHQANRDRLAIHMEYRSIDQRVGLCVRFPDELSEVVIAAVEASYPNCRLDVLDKKAVGEDLANNGRQISSAHLRLLPDLFPILRHSQFEDLPSRSFADPIDSLLRAVRPVGGSSGRIEIAIRPAGHRRRRRVRWAVQRLNTPFFRFHYHLAHRFARLATHRLLWPLAVLLGILAGRPGALVSFRPIDTSTGRHHEREDDVQAASDKIGGHLFETHIRLVVEADNAAPACARDRLEAMAGALGSFTVSRLATFRMARPRRGRLGARGGGAFLLSHEELATLFHPPTAGVGAERLDTNEFTEKEPPVPLPSGGDEGEVVIGRVKFRSEHRVFGIAREDRRRHLSIVGKTGMGKTTLLETQIAADIEAGRGVCLIDPHGDLAEAVLRPIPPRRTNDVIAFDAADRDYAVSFNPLACRDPDRIDQTTSGVVSAFKKIYESWGPRLEDTLRNAVFATVEQGGTLGTVLRLLSDQPFRERFVATIRDDLVRSFWSHEFAHWNDRYRTEAVAAIQNKIRPFLTNRSLRAIVGHSQRSLDFRHIMDDEQVLIVNLSKGRIGEDNSTLLGALLVAGIQQAAMSRADVSEEERPDFYLYVDEFQNFTTGSFATILSEARKYRLNLTVAHQYLKQLDDETANAVFGNVGSIVAFQVGSDDASVLAQQLAKFDGQLKPQDLTNLPKYTAYVRLLIDGLPSSPFSMETVPPPAFDPKSDRSTIVREMSRRRHAVPIVKANSMQSRFPLTVRT